MAAFDNSHITALTDLINKAVQYVIIQYAAAGQAIPSLDTLEPGPFAVPDEMPAGLAKAVHIIEAACAQLSYSVASPGSVIIDKALQHEEPACLLVVTEAQIADLLLDKPEGLSAAELAAHSGLDAGKLTRILRLLAAKHCFKEVKPGVFANNRLSMKLLSSDPVSSVVGLMTDECLHASAYLNNVLTDPSEMDGGIPFRRATGYSLYEYYKTHQGLKKGERFPRAMTGWLDITGQGSGFLAKVYPWASLPADTTICDIAGGNGHVSMGLLKAHPHLKLVLQDQPQVIDMAKKFWSEQHPSAIDKQRIEFVPFNFFKDEAVEGCDFYYIHFILCDWPDAESELILKNVRKAMKPSSRLIIHDIVLHDAVRNHELETSITDSAVNHQLYDVAPESLLPNYGVDRVRMYGEMTMMSLFNTQARTLPEFVGLCKKCSLQFEKLYQAGEMDLVEFSPI